MRNQVWHVRWSVTAIVLLACSILVMEPTFAQSEPDGVSVIVWSPDGNRLATGNFKSGLRIWNASTGQLIYRLSTRHWTFPLIWSPDGSKLAAGGPDKAIRIWSIKNGQVLQTLSAPQGVSVL